MTIANNESGIGFYIQTILQTVFAVLIVSIGPIAAPAVFDHQLVF